MKKITENLYWIFLTIFVFIFLWILLSFHIEIGSREQNSGYLTVSDYSTDSLQDSAMPMGVRQSCTFTLGENNFGHLIFYTVHQNVFVYLENELIYSLNASQSNSFGRTPGSIWNIIELNETDLGKEIRIELIPIYKGAIDSFPTIYLGDRYDVLSSIVVRNLPSFILSTIAILAGIFYIGYFLYIRRKGTTDNTLVMLGTFAIVIGLWKITDTDIFSFFVNNNLAAVYVPYFSLMLACVPYNIFIRNQLSSKEHWIWQVPCIVCYINMVIEIALQFLHIADFRETLPMTHFSIFFMVAVALVMIIREIRKCGLDKRLKVNIFCICICIAGLVIDTSIYYISNSYGVTLCGMLGFVIYIFVLGYSSVQEIRKLIAIGKEAKKYEQLAYHDELTGFLNRTAYADYINKEDFSPDNTLVAMFDLNNLKKCNDEFGHDKGDFYIITCAKLIADCFSDVGNCYRIGGDEFCVLATGISFDLCKERIYTLYQSIKKENEKQLIALNMEVACGYVIYDKLLDFDIRDTIRRADKMMYKEKYLMKNNK